MKPNKQTNLISQIKAARRVSVPIIAITTPDPAATIDAVCNAVVAKAESTDPAKIVWDIVSGMKPRNEEGKTAIANIMEGDDLTIGNPIIMLTLARKLPAKTLLFVHLANRWLVDAGVVQAAWNLRDAFKQDHRTLILLGPAIELPAELGGDVVVLDEPLPDAAALAELVKEQFTAASEQDEDGKQTKLDDTTLTRAVEAIQGLPAFQAEQVIAMSLSRSGLNLPDLWERKRRQIEQTPGLKVHREQVKFSDIGGVEVIKSFLSRVSAGQARPNAIVFVDEIEKFLAGASGDTSGVSQDQLGTLLAYMQDQNAAGCIFVGPPGSAKSMVAKATGNEAGVPTIQLDLGGMKGSLIGQSEQHLRAALKVITAVSNGRSLWIATCNAIADLPPELRRRFTLGTFFFDLPVLAERAGIWKIWLAKYERAKNEKLPEDEGWTGAEIKQCCDLAYRLGCTLIDAAKFVVPVSRSAAEKLAALRKAAEGRFLSASRGGIYSQATENVEAAGKRSTRKVTFED